MLAFLVFVSVLSAVGAWNTSGTWGTPCNPSMYTTNCSSSYPHCGPWSGASGSWTDNRCYCIPYSDGQCCNGVKACQDQGYYCQSNPLIYQCNTVNHQCRTLNTCLPAMITDSSEKNTSDGMMPISTSIPLMCGSFVVGLLLVYVIHRMKQSRSTTKYVAAEQVSSLSDSSHRALDESGRGDSQVEKNLNLAPLREQV